MDVKLRSLICMGLNEQVLHLWLEVLCSCADIVQKWFVIFQSISRTSEKTCALNFSLISCLFYFPKGIIHGVSYSVQDGYKLSVNFGFCLNLHSVWILIGNFLNVRNKLHNLLKMVSEICLWNTIYSVGICKILNPHFECSVNFMGKKLCGCPCVLFVANFPLMLMNSPVVLVSKTLELMKLMWQGIPQRDEFLKKIARVLYVNILTGWTLKVTSIKFL